MLEKFVGRTPGPRGFPLDPLFRPWQADEGVGRGPGGPPHDEYNNRCEFHSRKRTERKTTSF